MKKRCRVEPGNKATTDPVHVRVSGFRTGFYAWGGGGGTLVNTCVKQKLCNFEKISVLRLNLVGFGS